MVASMDALGLNLIGCNVDFLTATMSPGMDAHLLALTDPDEAGNPGRGFARSEKRVCIGGTCWRRWEPYQPSRSFGTDYSSWEWAGGGSRHYADILATGRTGPSPAGTPPVRPSPRASRIDIAFDFSCPDSFTSDQLVAPLEDAEKPGHTQDGLIMRIAGGGGVHTRYLGALSSPKMIRVYRKDLQLSTWAEMFGPTLRVELVLKDDYAAALLRIIGTHGLKHAYAVAAGHVATMTGWHLIEEPADVPEIVQPEGRDLAERLLPLFQQYGQLLATLDDAGLPVLDLCRCRCGSKASRSRLRKLKDGLSKDLANVTEILRSVLSAPAVAPVG
jgi:hypothetical protein